MSCQLANPYSIPGVELELHTFLQNASNVRSYQTRVSIIRTSGTGMVTIPCNSGTGDPHVRVDRLRPDFIFAAFPSSVSATNCPFRAAGSALPSGGVNVGATPAYLSTYTMLVSGDATPGSTFEISFDPPPASAVGMVGGGMIPLTFSPPCVLTIVAPETLEFGVEVCSACVSAPATVQVPMFVSGLDEPINGVQALFSFDPTVLSLTGATAGDGMGSPWDAGAVVYVDSDDGDGTIAIVLNGTSSAIDSQVATLLFDVVGVGNTSVTFRPPSGPFATKLTTVDNETIIPTQWDSPPILSGDHSKSDVNGDGLRNGADVQGFIDVLLMPGSASPQERCASDLDGDGMFTVAQDLPLFVDCLVAAICPCP